jgi:mxaK protein
MGSRVKQKNIVFGVCLVTGLLGALYEAYQCYRIDQVNQSILAGQSITDDGYPYQQKFSAAYHQGTHFDYKHAIQTYGQLLETNPEAEERARIQFNIGNNLFLSGLIRRVNDDGSLKDEAKYAFSQAKVAYEQSLRLAPDSRKAKFNLSLLHAILPQNMKGAPKDQSGVALSNLPIGLP